MNKTIQKMQKGQIVKLIMNLLFMTTIYGYAQDKEVYIIFKEYTTINLKVEKPDNSFSYNSCDIRKYDIRNEKVRFNICGNRFDYEKETNSLTKIKLKDINENNIFTFEEFFNAPDLHLSKDEISLFFLEIVDKETYLKYPVQKSKHIYSDDSTFFKQCCKEAFISGNLEDSHYVLRDKFVMSNNLKHK